MTSSGGDGDDVDALYRRYGPAVYRRARALLHDDAEAFDVTQETFLAFLKARPALRGEALSFTVLYQIATYQAVDRLRRRARWSEADGTRRPELADRTQLRGDPAERADGDTCEEGHLGGLSRVEAAQDLATLTRGEDPQTLTAAVLYYVEGHTTEEVAVILDISRKTVGRMLSRFAVRARKRGARLDGRAA